MLDFELLLTVTVLLFWAAVLGGLYHRFTRAGTERSYALLAATAIALGLLLAIPGLLHTIAVVGAAVNADKPYDLRLAWLITLGVMLVHGGLANAVLSRWIRRGERWALAMAATLTALLLAFFIILNPATSQDVLILLTGAYLTLLLFRLARPAPRVAGT